MSEVGEVALSMLKPSLNRQNRIGNSLSGCSLRVSQSVWWLLEPLLGVAWQQV
jgi:hypothetical protein